SARLWVHYWSQQLGGVRTEVSGARAVRPGLISSGKGWPRLRALSEQVGLQIPVLVLAFLLLPVVLLGVDYARRGHASRRDWLRKPRRTVAALLAMVVMVYLPWYLFASPLDWLRRFAIGWIA